MKYKGFLALLLTALILGSFGVLIKYMNQSFSSNMTVAVRSSIPAILAFGLLIYKRSGFELPKGNLKAMSIFLFAYALSLVLFTYAVTKTKVSTSIFLLYAGSITSTFLVGTFYFKEKVTTQKILALVFVVIGMLMFFYPFDFSDMWIAYLCAFAGGFGEGLTHAARKSLSSLKRELMIFYQNTFTAIFALVLGIVVADNLVTNLTPNVIFVSIIFGLLIYAIGYLLLYGFKYIDVNVGAIILSSELFFTVIFNYFFLMEIPTALELTGGIIIFIAANVAEINFRKFFGKTSDKV